MAKHQGQDGETAAGGVGAVTDSQHLFVFFPHPGGFLGFGGRDQDACAGAFQGVVELAGQRAPGPEFPGIKEYTITEGLKVAGEYFDPGFVLAPMTEEDVVAGHGLLFSIAVCWRQLVGGVWFSPYVLNTFECCGTFKHGA
uniref:Uncharacterized protein n=1 Tax=Candidatus Kentrum sp. MB TaxID=2138164 RepID=A0A451B7D9_9GAMM|nr:MAG: hypothetical protein BECKMB1821I_GA0114274_10063 [Candidatus Kentron sp. MB]VFK74201.1 MAG: hypothetical protein BECKMB1821H_GA0114242_100221 [Candidatus Kentron sp. MB]